MDEKSPDERRVVILGELSVGKCSNMDLGNHRTAWNALKGLPAPHKDNLKRMGYSFLLYSEK